LIWICDTTSDNFSYTGLLIATFGAEQMLSGCGGLEDSHWEVYQALLDQVVAIACVLFSDLLFGPPRPSKLAVQAYSEASSFSRWSLAEMLQPLRPADGATAAPLRAKLFALLHRAEAQGVEAAMEPRFIRTPWREELWSTLIRQSFRMAEKLAVMEHIAARSALSACACSDKHQASEEAVPQQNSVVSIVRSKALQEVAEDFLQQREDILSLAQELMLHESDSPVGGGREADAKDTGVPADGA